jgi:hypothetical protein
MSEAAAATADAPSLNRFSSSSSGDTRITHSDVSSISSGNSSSESVLVSVVGTDLGRTTNISLGSATGAAAAKAAAERAPVRDWKWKLVNYAIIPVSLPLLAVYWLVALLLGVTASFMVWPSLLLAQRLYWACPFIPYIWRR